MNWLNINRSSAISLTRQIYLQLREAILAGRLQSGQRIPSTRELSSQLNVSRNIVVEAFDQLQAEGYIVGKHGSGAYVEERLYLNRPGASPPPYSLSNEPSVEITEEASVAIDFRSGQPCLNSFPRRKWGLILKEICDSLPPSKWSYGAAKGILDLRRALADYLHLNRGVVCGPEQIIITAGAVQALFIAARALPIPSAPVLIEDPASKDISGIFTLAGRSIYPCPVDRHGLITDLLPRNINQAHIFVTPSHQFPIGGHLPVKRRVELVQYSRLTNSFIIEDDYDSEFRYQGSPISSLQGLAPDRVIYAGSFSKSLFPSLRLGCLVAPDELVDKCCEIKRLTDVQCPSLEQFAMAKFIHDGHFIRHISRMRKIYKAKRDLLLKELKSRFKQIDIYGDSTGMHLVIRFPDKVFDQTLLETCKNEGVIVYPVEEHALVKGMYTDCVILGYGHLDAAQISKGITRLAAALDKIQ